MPSRHGSRVRQVPVIIGRMSQWESSEQLSAASPLRTTCLFTKCHYATPRSLFQLMSVFRKQSATLQPQCDAKVILRGNTLSTWLSISLSHNDFTRHSQAIVRTWDLVWWGSTTSFNFNVTCVIKDRIMNSLGVYCITQAWQHRWQRLTMLMGFRSEEKGI